MYSAIVLANGLPASQLDMLSANLQAFLGNQRNCTSIGDLRVQVDSEVLEAYLFTRPTRSWTVCEQVYHYWFSPGSMLEFGFSIYGR